MSELALATLLVSDYDEAIRWFRVCLDFELVEDTALSAQKRWVVVAPRGRAAGTGLLLAKADGPEQRAAIGRQAGDCVFLFLRTDDFSRDQARMAAAGVRFLEAPRHETYATVAVFVDLCGNRWDLLGPPA